MNKLHVTCYNEELMRKADEEFMVVIHQPEDDNKENYSGEFIIYDPRSESVIKEIIKSFHTELKQGSLA